MGKTNSLLVVSVISGTAVTVRLVGSLFIIWLTLGWKVRKAKKAFEKELMKQGMSKQDAERISGRYAALKDQAVNAFKGSFSIFSLARARSDNKPS